MPRNYLGKPERHKWRSDAKWWNLLKPLARELRKVPTPAEIRLWASLRNRQLGGLKFRRQHSIERFIVDFYCAEAGLIVEVDGDVHLHTVEHDQIRQAYLESMGLTICRIKNDEIFDDLAGVLARIENAAKLRAR